MTHVIREPCVGVLDRAGVGECPVDCIHEGERMLSSTRMSAWTAGAREPVCSVEAVYYEDDLSGKWQAYAGENAKFFAGRAEPLPAAASRSAASASLASSALTPVRRRPAATRKSRLRKRRGAQPSAEQAAAPQVQRRP